MAQIRSKPFGVTKEGANVTEYTLPEILISFIRKYFFP